MIQRTLPIAVRAALACVCGVLVTAARAAEHVDWPNPGNDKGGTRYAAVDQINRHNVKDLAVAWTYNTGDMGTGTTIECTPLVVDGVMYVTTVKTKVVALDAALLAEHVTPEQLRQATATAARWAGARRAVRAVELADGRAESPLETRGRLRIIGAGLPTPELQVEIRVGGRLVAVVDGWFDDAAVAVEFDGRVKYTDPWRDRSPGQVLWEEKRREDALRALDVRVVRIADADVGPAWPATEQRLRHLTSTPGPMERRFTAQPRMRGLRRSG